MAEMGLAEAVTFAGHASDATVAAAYAQADVLVVTSAHEGFCVPVTEAMAVGLPVVAYAQGALPEVLGGAGVLVDSVDPYRLAATIADLLADPARGEELGEAGRRQLAALDLDGAGERFVDLVCALTLSSPVRTRGPGHRRLLDQRHEAALRVGQGEPGGPGEAGRGELPAQRVVREDPSDGGGEAERATCPGAGVRRRPPSRAPP